MRNLISESQKNLRSGILKETFAKPPWVGASSVDFGGTKEEMLVGTLIFGLESTLVSSFWEGDTRLIRGFSLGKVNGGSPPPMGEILKDEEGIETLLLLARDIARKMKGKSGVTQPDQTPLLFPRHVRPEETSQERQRMEKLQVWMKAP